MAGLESSGADVIDYSITENIVSDLSSRYIFRLFPNNHRQLGLIIEILHQVPVAWYLFPCACGTVYPFREIYRKGAFPAECFLLISGRFLRMGHIVDAQADHILYRMGNRRQQKSLLHGNCPFDLIGILP